MSELSTLPAVLTPSEVQRVLRIGRRQTYSLLDSKKLDSVRVGRSIRIPKSSLLAYLGEPEHENGRTASTQRDRDAGGDSGVPDRQHH
jgi:excisionase family DNA binding protein